MIDAVIDTIDANRINYLTEINLHNKIIEACTNGDLAILPKLMASVKIMTSIINSTLESIHSITQYVNIACVNNHPGVIKWFIDQKYSLYLEKIMNTACKLNHIEIINIIMQEILCTFKYTETDIKKVYLEGCYGACEGGNLEIFTLLNTSTFRNFTIFNVDSHLLHCVGRGGNLDLILLILRMIKGYHIENGIVTFIENDGDDGNNEAVKSIFNYILMGSCYNGKHHIIKFAVDNGANNWNMGMTFACFDNHIEAIKLMVQYGANDWDRGLHTTCCRNRNNTITESMLYMIEKGASNWNECLLSACYAGNIELAKLMISRGADNLNDGLKESCFSSNIEITNLMISYGANDWNGAISRNVWNKASLKNLLVRKGATNLDKLEDENEFKLACHYSRYKREDPSVNDKCNRLLVTYPVYVLLCSKYGTSAITPRCIKKLPLELFRLLHQYF